MSEKPPEEDGRRAAASETSAGYAPPDGVPTGEDRVERALAAEEEATTPDREEPPRESTVSLRLANGPLVGPTLCRVASIVLARANCPMDRIDDAMLICDALSAHAPPHAVNHHLSFVLSTRGRQFELRVGELSAQGAGNLMGDAVLPGVGSVLERMTDTLHVEPAGDGAGEELVLGISF